MNELSVLKLVDISMLTNFSTHCTVYSYPFLWHFIAVIVPKQAKFSEFLKKLLAVNKPSIFSTKLFNN